MALLHLHLLSLSSSSSSSYSAAAIPTSVSSLLSSSHRPLSPKSCRSCHQSTRSSSRQCHITYCRLSSSRVKEPASTSNALVKEPHKYFDHVIITVRSGDGGHGSVLSMPSPKDSSKSQGKNEKNKTRKGPYRRDADGSLILPIGGYGGDVVVYADESKHSLLEFHQKTRYNAKRGGNVDAMGVLKPFLHDGAPSPTLRIPVPLGTVVRRKQGGKLLADLVNPGDEILVARGGQGGISLLEMPEHKRKKMVGMTTNVMRDEGDKVLVLGQPGEEVRLELILRVVADVGLVGLPNAGKSTLLAAITHAKPDIADYPFTTLMPNLGRLDGDPTVGAQRYSSQATLADLPGLIEGAHLGKGLGRNFLRHLRRTRLLVHVVDAAGENPVGDYITVREELRMYNPEYLERPHIVVLNKIDLPKAIEKLPKLVEELSNIGVPEVTSASGASTKEILMPVLPQKSNDNLFDTDAVVEDCKEDLKDYPRPLSVVGVSVLKGMRVDDMLKEIRAALRKCLSPSAGYKTEL